MPRTYVTPTVQLVYGADLSAIAGMNSYETSVIEVDAADNAPARQDSGLAQLAASVGQAFSRSNDRPDAYPTTEEARARFEKLNAHIEIKEYTHNRVVFETNTLAPGLFNYSDGCAEGWRVRIDGEDVPVYRANHVFKAVVLPPGQHRVESIHDPPSFHLGLVLPLGSVCVWAG